MRATFLFLITFCFCVVGCGDEETPGLLADVTVDASSDAVAADAEGTDTDISGADTTPDSEPTDADAGDGREDVDNDTVEPDVTPDAELDAPEDAAVDSAPEIDAAPDTTAPTVLSSDPVDGLTLTTRQNIVVVFDESIDPNQLTVGGSLSDESAAPEWSGTNAVGDTLTISPSESWSTGDGVTLELTVSDLAGNASDTLRFTFDVRCRNDNGCISPALCESGLCIETACETADVCSSFDGCVDGFCGSCERDDQCRSLQECDRGICVDLPTCETATDCAEGLVCSDNLCAGCSTDEQCAEGYGARNGCGGGTCAGLATEFCAAFGQTCDEGQGCTRQAANEYVCEFNGCGRTQIFDGTSCTDIGIL